MSSGIGLDPGCVPAYTELQRPPKSGQKSKYIIYKISDDKKCIQVAEVGPANPDVSEEDQYEAFVKKLPETDCRWAVYDVGFEKEGGKRNKVTFVTWAPSDAPVKSRMMYASSKDALRKALNGVACEVQATDLSEVLWEEVLAKVSSKGN